MTMRASSDIDSSRGRPRLMDKRNKAVASLQHISSATRLAESQPQDTVQLHQST